MEVDILQQESMIKEMANKQIETLLKDLSGSFKSIATKEEVEEKDVQLCIRYDSTQLSSYLMSRISDLSRKKFQLSADEQTQLKSLTEQPEIDAFWKVLSEKNNFQASTIKPLSATEFTAASSLPEDADFQLGLGFKLIDAEIPNGDCNFFYQILKSWTAIESKQWLDDVKKGVLESFLVEKLSFVTDEFKVTSWVDVSIIFHIQKGVVKMSVYTNDENKNPVHRKSFVLADEPIKDMSLISFYLLKNWQPFRKANFSKDFLNAETIMKDEREDLIRIYLAGGKIQIPGMADPIVMPGNLDLVSVKHNLKWNDISFIFFKKDNDSKPELGIYEVVKIEEAPGIKFELKETVDIFSLKDDAGKEGTDDQTQEGSEK